MAFKFNRDKLQELIEKDIKDFCRRSGCSRQQVHLYLKQGMTPSVSTLEEIAKGFDLPSDYFFDDIEVEA